MISPLGTSEPINRYPDCLNMGLQFACDEQSDEPTESGIEVSLMIDFRGDQTIPILAGDQLGLPNGELSFGIRRAKLQLFLDSCKLPLTRNAMVQGCYRPTAVETRVKEEAGIGKGKPLPSSRLETLYESDIVTSAELEDISVERSGSDESPVWTFEAQGKQKILQGRLPKVVLGQLLDLSMPCEVIARVTVNSEDVRLNWGGGPASLQISRNKVAVIQSILTREYIKPTLCSRSFSGAVWRYE